jgi:hypothetical protein
MKRNIGLLVLTLIIAAAALVVDVRFDRRSNDARTHVLVVEREHAQLSTTLARLRAAQAAYVAAGQGYEFWMTSVTDLAAKASAALTRMREEAASQDAEARYRAADAALAEFNKIDGRVRDFVRDDQKLFASDLIFIDGLQSLEKVDAELGAARSAQTAAAERAFIEVSRLRLALNAAAFAGLAVLVFLVRPQPAAAEPKQAPSTAQMLKELPPPVKKTPVPAPATLTPAPLPVAQPVAKTVNLSAAAELCVDLARVADARDMPTLVQRAAAVLEAKGVVLWVADTSGSSLRPSLTHGYADRIVARMGPLQVDSENVTALAYRTMEPQTVNGTSPADAGAVAVPLITPSGCVGVLAAETRPNRNGQELLPLARIIAAQFASIVAPADTGVMPAEPAAGARTAQA